MSQDESAARTQAVINLLRGARARITERGHWTQGTCARNRYGHKVPLHSPRAVRWCLLGALCAETGECSVGEALEALRSIQRNPTQWNDEPGRKHSDVLAAFDAAITLLEAVQP